jgi:spore germination protein KB
MKLEAGKIANTQLFFLALGMLLGSSMILNPAQSIGRDGWLAVLAGMVEGFFFLGVMVTLAGRFKGQTLVQMNETIFGSLLGKIVSLVYLAYFWHLGSIVLRDFGDFYLAIVYPETPLVVIILLLALLCASAVRNGLEVLGRCSVFLVPIAVFFIIFDSLLLIEKIELSNLLPVLDVPWKDLLKVSHGVATFPFGEAVIFLMVMAFSNNQRQVRKTMFGAMFTAGVLLSWLAARNTGVLGSIVCIQAYPSFPVIRYINLGEIFTRLEIVVAAVLLSLGFIKITVFYYGTVLGLAQLMRLRSYLPLVLPVGAMMVFLGACVFQSNVENINFSFNISLIFWVSICFEERPSYLASRFNFRKLSKRLGSSVPTARACRTAHPGSVLWVQSRKRHWVASLSISEKALDKSTASTPNSLIPGVSITIPPWDRTSNSRWVVVCLPLSSCRVSAVASSSSPANRFINVDFPTPDEPIKDAVTPSRKKSNS